MHNQGYIFVSSSKKLGQGKYEIDWPIYLSYNFAYVLGGSSVHLMGLFIVGVPKKRGKKTPWLIFYYFVKIISIHDKFK